MNNPDRMIPGIDTYPNLGPPEAMPDGFKTLKALPGHQASAPKISWGDKFKSWPVERQIRWAKKIADAMNHAADIAQTRVMELIEIANRQELQLTQAKQNIANQQGTMVMLATRHNEQQQARLQEMQALKAELRTAKKRIAELEGAE